MRAPGEGVRADRACEFALVSRGLPRDDAGWKRLHVRMHGHVPAGQGRVWRRPGDLRRDVLAAAAPQLV
jgi:hypothetical protein